MKILSKIFSKKILLPVLLFFIIIVFYLIPHHSHAAPPNSEDPNRIRTVYRLSNQAPEVVFDRGFNSWGENNSLIDHVSGRSLTVGARRNLPEGRTSSFISTSASSIVIPRDLLDEYQGYDGQQFYLYNIRATDNFYNVNYSLNRAISLYGSDSRTGLMARELLDRFGYQQEYAAFGFIPRRTIRSVLVYRYFANEGIWRVANSIPNPHYIDENTSSSEQPWLGLASQTRDEDTLWEARGTDVIDRHMLIGERSDAHNAAEEEAQAAGSSREDSEITARLASEAVAGPSAGPWARGGTGAWFSGFGVGSRFNIPSSSSNSSSLSSGAWDSGSSYSIGASGRSGSERGYNADSDSGSQASEGIIENEAQRRERVYENAIRTYNNVVTSYENAQESSNQEEINRWHNILLRARDGVTLAYNAILDIPNEPPPYPYPPFSDISYEHDSRNPATPPPYDSRNPSESGSAPDRPLPPPPYESNPSSSASNVRSLDRIPFGAGDSWGSNSSHSGSNQGTGSLAQLPSSNGSREGYVASWLDSMENLWGADASDASISSEDSAERREYMRAYRENRHGGGYTRYFVEDEVVTEWRGWTSASTSGSVSSSFLEAICPNENGITPCYRNPMQQTATGAPAPDEPKPPYPSGPQPTIPPTEKPTTLKPGFNSEGKTLPAIPTPTPPAQSIPIPKKEVDLDVDFPGCKNMSIKVSLKPGKHILLGYKKIKIKGLDNGIKNDHNRVNITLADYIYVISSKIPSEVFKNGLFINNPDRTNIPQKYLLNGLQGGMESPSSTFIIGTTSYTAAADYLEKHSNLGISDYYFKKGKIEFTTMNPLYIYKVRATRNFYDATASLDAALQSDQTIQAKELINNALKRYDFTKFNINDTAHIMVTNKNISSHLIESGIVYYGPPNRPDHYKIYYRTFWKDNKNYEYRGDFFSNGELWKLIYKPTNKENQSDIVIDNRFNHPAIVNTVFKLSSQSPEKIFKEGFKISGDENNKSLVPYIEGTIANNPFISTTSNINNIYDFAFHSPIFEKENVESIEVPLYIYIIRASDNFYDVTRSITNSMLHETNKIKKNYLRNLLGDYKGNEEYVSHGDIKNTQIIGVYTFKKGLDEKWYQTKTIQNSSYEPILTQSSNNFWTQTFDPKSTTKISSTEVDITGSTGSGTGLYYTPSLSKEVCLSAVIGSHRSKRYTSTNLERVVFWPNYLIRWIINKIDGNNEDSIEIDDPTDKNEFDNRVAKLHGKTNAELLEEKNTLIVAKKKAVDDKIMSWRNEHKTLCPIIEHSDVKKSMSIFAHYEL